MKRVYVVYTRAQQDELIRRLQRLGVLHLEEAPLADPEAEPRTEAELAEVRREAENLLIKARGVLDLFAEVDPQLVRAARRPSREPERRAAGVGAEAGAEPEVERLSRRFRDELDALEKELRALVAERRALRDRLATVERFREVVQAAEELLRGLPTAGREVLGFLGEARSRAALEQAERTLQEALAGRCALVQRPLSEDRLLVLVSVEPEHAAAVREYLEAKGLRPLAFPPHVEAARFEDAIAQLRADETTLPRRLEELDARLRTLAAEHVGRLIPLATALENRLAQLDAALKFGYTDFSLIVTGWVPEDELPRFREALEREFPGIVVGEDPQPARPEEVPVAFRNPPWARPYQLLLELVGLPKYGTVDPTPFVSVFFPVFFGLIIGDVGYGMSLLLLALWARRRWGPRSEALRHGLTIGVHSAVMAIVFGLIFGEFFGFIPYQPPFHRVEEAEPLLLFTVALGAAHLLLGFLIGAVNAVRERSPKHLAAKVGAIVLLVTLGVIVGTIAGLLPESLRTPGIGLLVAAVFLLLYGEGFVGMLEIFTYVGHVISYARLMGFGLAAAVLAELANKAAGAVGNVLLGVLVGVALHAGHLVLGSFESGIQSARLHLVEFFQKFYEMGGKRYDPFRLRERVDAREVVSVDGN